MNNLGTVVYTFYRCSDCRNRGSHLVKPNIKECRVCNSTNIALDTKRLPIQSDGTSIKDQENGLVYPGMEVLVKLCETHNPKITLQTPKIK